MSSDSAAPSTNELAGQRTDLANRRSRWAADRTLFAIDRTLIAWIRTAIALIGFGIAIGKAGDALETQGIVLDNYRSLKVLGVSFISLAVLGLIGAVIQNLRVERRMAREGFGRVEPVPLGLVMSILVLLVGLAGAFFILV